MSTIYRKINNKALIADKSDSLEGLWRRNMLVGPKQTKLKKKTLNEIEVLGCLLLTIAEWRALTPSLESRPRGFLGLDPP